MSTRKHRRGFAAMDPELQRRIARNGGRAAHRKTSQKASAADREARPPRVSDQIVEERLH